MIWPLVMCRNIESAVIMGEHGDTHDPELNPHCNIIVSLCIKSSVIFTMYFGLEPHTYHTLLQQVSYLACVSMNLPFGFQLILESWHFLPRII